MSSNPRDFWITRQTNLPWTRMQLDHFEKWFIASARAPAGSENWWAWGTLDPIQGFCPLSEPSEPVYAQFASTREEAVRLLKEELATVFVGLSH